MDETGTGSLIDLPPLTLEQKREGALWSYAEGRSATEVADLWEIEVIDVARWVRLAAKAGDARAIMGADREMARARYNQAAIVAAWREGQPIELIAKAMRLKPEEVRAAVYLAVKDGSAGGAFSGSTRASPPSTAGSAPGEAEEP